MTPIKLSINELAGHEAEEIEEILKQKNSTSTFEDYQNFQVLKIRRLSLTEEALTFDSDTFLINQNGIYIYDHDDKFFRQLENGQSEMLQFLERFYSGNKKIIAGYSDEIERLENRLFERSIPAFFMDFWFDLKKDIAGIENFYFRNAMVYREFYKACEHWMGDFKDGFRDIDDTIHFHTANLNTLKTRMDSLHHYYNSIKSDQLNRTLLALTLISGIFLPLNLIVGFFGMNTKGLFLEENPDATQMVLSILISIVVVSVVGIPLVRILNRFVLQRLLGRYDFYLSITKKIRKLEQHIHPKL